jgi:cell pole-organizing protein PopZ
MEEILASIRRILNDDDSPPAPADGAEVPAANDDVLVLDESMMVSAHEPARYTAASEPVVLLPEANAPPAHEMEAITPTPNPDPREQPAPTSDLVAPEAAAAAASSVGSLVRTLAAGRATQVYGGGPTLEDMVRAELRPLLKEWLDVNLPPVVERLVRAEIERVVGRQVP